MYKWYLLVACSTVFTLTLKCQDSTTALSFTAYGEIYYVYDFSRPPTHTRPPFVYSYNRTEEVNINLAFIKASFANQATRANLAFMGGTYSNANLASEPGVLKNIFEANAGVRISKQHQLWIDAGVMPSHIGQESAVGKDNWTLTRSLGADNSPYYETGVRLSYGSANQKWYTAVLFLNGWQRMQRVEGNHTPSFGTQVTFKPSKKILINSSSFIGSDQPDSLRRMRYFHNLYSVIQLNGWLGLTIGMDIGWEQKSKGSASMNCWYTPMLILRSQVAKNKFISLRIEHYNDKAGVIISNANGNPFSIWSCSSNFDLQLNEKILWRVEAKWMKSRYPTFLQEDGSYNETNWSTSTSLCFSF